MDKKPTHGGSRKGAGRKPTGEPVKQTTSMRLSPDILRYYRETGLPMAETFEEHTRRTRAFREWVKSHTRQEK